MERQRWWGMAAVAIVASVTTVGVTQFVGAAGSGGGTASSLVPIVPCRLADTRPAPDNVGPRATPLDAGETLVVQVTGANGNCVVPAGATGIAANVTAVGGTAASFLTMWPADAERPVSANLNWTASASPTPNQVTVGLSAGGAVAAYNYAGTVHLVIDVVGYYAPTPAGATGPAGPAGPVGPLGGRGPAGVDATLDVVRVHGPVPSPLTLNAATPTLLAAASITIDRPSMVFGSISASLGSAGGPFAIEVDLCVAVGGSNSYSFLTGQYMEYSISGIRNPVTVTSAASLAAGTYSIGMRARSGTGAPSLTGNDWVNGWVSWTPV